jgi:hypothetical protein
MDDVRMTWIKSEMMAYDQLTPEMRAVVQEYGHLPWDPRMPAEEFRAGEQYMRELDQKWLLNELVSGLTIEP